MTVMNNALIANGGAFGPTAGSRIANVVDGGQLGFGPILTNLDANTPPVFLPLQLVVTHVPTFFKFIPNGAQIFKALFETHLTSFDGLDFEYTMDVDGTPVGRDGQMQNVPTRQTRSQITPTANWSEKIGNVVFNFGRLWMNSMRNVDTQASSFAGIIPEGTTLPPLVASMYAATFLLIQYDSTYRPENIIDAIALTNVFPTSIGSPGYQLNAIETHRPDRSFTFNCIVQHNPNTINAARSIATLTNLHRINYQDATSVAESIASDISNMGMNHLVSEEISKFRNNDGRVR